MLHYRNSASTLNYTHWTFPLWSPAQLYIKIRVSVFVDIILESPHLSCQWALFLMPNPTAPCNQSGKWILFNPINSCKNWGWALIDNGGMNWLFINTATKSYNLETTFHKHIFTLPTLSFWSLLFLFPFLFPSTWLLVFMCAHKMNGKDRVYTGILK